MSSYCVCTKVNSGCVAKIMKYLRFAERWLSEDANCESNVFQEIFYETHPTDSNVSNEHGLRQFYIKRIFSCHLIYRVAFVAHFCHIIKSINSGFKLAFRVHEALRKVRRGNDHAVIFAVAWIARTESNQKPQLGSNWRWLIDDYVVNTHTDLSWYLQFYSPTLLFLSYISQVSVK